MHRHGRAPSSLLSAFLSGLLLASAAPAAGARAQDKNDKKAQEAKPAPPAVAADALERGRKQLGHGDAAGALSSLQSALELYTRADWRPGVAVAHELLGELYERQGLYDLALRYYSRALADFEAAAANGKDGRRKDAAYNVRLLRGRVGHVNQRLGRRGAARAIYASIPEEQVDRRALRELKTKGAGAGALGLDLFGGNRKDGALDTAVKKGISAGAGLFAATSVYDHYRKANAYADRELGLGRLDFDEGQDADARRHFDNVLDATDPSVPFLGKLGRTRRYRVAARTALGDLALKEGRLEEAVKLYDEAADDAVEAGRLDLAWPAQRGLGRAHRRLAEREPKPERQRERRRKALDAYGAAVESVEALRQGSVRADEARAVFLTTTRAVYEEAAAMHAALALAAAPPGRPLGGEALKHAEASFHLAERGRARSLLELLGEAGAHVEGGIAPADVERRRRNLEEQQEVARRLTGLRLSAGGGDEKDEDVEKLNERADELHEQYLRIENDIRSRHPGYGELTAAEPLTLEAVRAQLLDAGTALLAYSLGAERSYLFAVTNEGVTLHELPARARLDELADALREQILPRTLRRPLIALTDDEAYRGLRLAPSGPRPDPAPFARAAHELYQAVVAPAAAFVGERRLLVVPEGSLSYVPFEALVTAEGGADYAALAYLLKRHEVVYAPSASVVAALRRQAATTDAGRRAAAGAVLVVADPVFDAGDPRARQAAAEAPRPPAPDALVGAARDVTQAELGGAARLARLDGTRAEAEQIERLAVAAGRKVEKLLDLDASETNAARRDLRPYGVLHFATHGLLNAERPHFTGLVLSLVGDREADGFLRTGEVFNLRLGSPLVMLSACETGLGKERRGEGVIGLTRAFMYAGAPTVGVSLWSVSDQSTAQLMAAFYKHLLGGAGGPAAAMREARLGLIDGRQYSAPFHWAPFVMVGDWR